MHPDIKMLEYDYITDGIYIGTNHCCQVHFDEKLKVEGVTANMSLEAESIDIPFGVSMHMWIPVVDHTPPTQDQLEFGAATLLKLVSMKKKIYVHCKNGHGRAPTMVAAYLILKGMKVQEAIDLIKSKRESIHPNEDQVAALEHFYSKINK